MSDYDLYSRGLRRPRIYVSGPMAKAPYTGPRAAFLLARRLWLAGWHPIVPHANMAFELAAGVLDPASADGIGGWLEYDFSMMADCMFLVRVTSEGMADVPSSGTDRECALAEFDAVGITVLTEEQALEGPSRWWPEAIDTTRALCDTLKEVDDTIRHYFPNVDHALSASERLSQIFGMVPMSTPGGKIEALEDEVGDLTRQVRGLECEKVRLQEEVQALKDAAKERHEDLMDQEWAR